MNLEIVVMCVLYWLLFWPVAHKNGEESDTSLILAKEGKLWLIPVWPFLYPCLIVLILVIQGIDSIRAR